MKIEEVKAFAKKHGYDDAVYLEKWKGFDVYEPVFDGDEPSFVGVPLVILVKGDTVRMSTVEEAFEQLNHND